MISRKEKLIVAVEIAGISAFPPIGAVRIVRVISAAVVVQSPRFSLPVIVVIDVILSFMVPLEILVPDSLYAKPDDIHESDEFEYSPEDLEGGVA